ncbi:caspase family protein [Armatimonas sp.]|uniref:caspase family protein n=1 Tax=Armatimonas sp. TaxID=1872638 RepID=UPI00375280F4
MNKTLISLALGLSLALSTQAGSPQTAKPKPKPTPPAVKPTTPAPQVPVGPLKMMPPTAHTVMDRAEVSPDGRWVATSGGGQIRIWESDTGRTTRELPCSGLLHWMKDSQRLLVGGMGVKAVRSDDGTVDDDKYGRLQLWDVVSGKLLKEWQIPSVILDFQRYESEVVTLDVTQDETRALVTTRGVGQAFVCDIAAGTMPIKLTEPTGVDGGHFLPGDREFAIYYVRMGYEKKIRQTDRYETATGKKLGTLPVNAPATAYSPSGHVFVTVLNAELLGVKRNTEKVDDEKEGAGVVVEEATGKVVRTVESGFVGFSPDGKSLVRVVGTRFSLVDLLSGKETLSKSAPVRGIVVEGVGDSAADAAPQATGPLFAPIVRDDLTTVSFRQDGKQLVSVTRDGRATLWNAASLTPQNSLRGWTYSPYSLFVAPDGKTALVNTSQGAYRRVDGWLGSLRVLDPRTGQTRFWTDYTAELLDAIYTPDGKTIYLVAWNPQYDRAEVRRLDLETNTLSEPLFLKPGFTPRASLALSPDGASLYCLGYLLDAKSGRERARLSGLDGETRAAFNDQNQLVALIKTDSGMRAFATYDAQSGARLSQTPAFRDNPWKGKYLSQMSYPLPVFIDGGKAVLIPMEIESGTDAVDNQATVVRREVSTGHISHVWEPVFTLGLNDIIVSPGDGRALVFDSSKAEWSVWNASSGLRQQVLRKFDGVEVRGGGGVTPALLPDGKHLLTLQSDDSLRVRDLSGKTRLSFLMLEGGDWLAYTPEGAFDGSQGAIEKVYFSSGSKTYSLDQFAERFYRPGLVQLVLDGKEGVNPLSPEAALAQGAPPSVQLVAPATSTTSAAEVTITVKAVQQNGGGVRALRLYHNGRLVGGTSSLSGAASTVQSELTRTFTIALEPGQNQLRATAYSRTNLESKPAELRLVSTAVATTKPVLRVLSVGINKYEDPAMNLEYARPDAEAFGQFFEGQKTLFSGVKVTSLLDEKATGKNIEAAIKALATESKPSDIVVIYLAGHGETAAAKPADDDVESAAQSFYFLPAEMRLMRDKNNVRKYGISGDQLDSLISQIGARRILIVYDACKSGAALNGSSTGGAQEQRQLALLARAQGLYILTASTSQQYASEVKALGHGILTYALLEGLRGKAAPTESDVKVLSLLNYAEQRVPALAKELRNRDQRPVRYGRGVNFPLANK